MELCHTINRIKYGFLFFTGVVILLFLCLELFHKHQQYQINYLAGERPSEAVTQLIETSRFKNLQCRVQTSDTEIVSVAHSLLIIENHSISWMEYTIEALFVQWYFLTGQMIFDFSIGPAQIRPSTAFKAFEIELFNEDKKKEIVSDLMDRCHVMRIIFRILKNEILIKKGPDGLISRPEILRVAKAWNGQKTSDSLKAVISKSIYNEMLYQIFLKLRFF